MRITKEELAKKLGVDAKDLVVAKVRNANHGLISDAGTNGRKLGTECLGDILTAYKRLERLADGKVTRNGADFPVTLSEPQIEWLEDKIAAMHGKVFDALRSGTRVKAVVDAMPTA